ncbi:hypothetical protein B0H13DRAFT_2378524 [Mycena leptocephala]|nr:hypothetical protein B0H13DRAFT_2378524 [Mycena leptocephala]
MERPCGHDICTSLFVLLLTLEAYLRIHDSDYTHPLHRCLHPRRFAVRQLHGLYKLLCSAVSVSKPEKEHAPESLSFRCHSSSNATDMASARMSKVTRCFNCNVIPLCFSSHKLANHLINLFAFSVLRTLCAFLCYAQFQFTQLLVLSASTPLLAPSSRLAGAHSRPPSPMTSPAPQPPLIPSNVYRFLDRTSA